MTQEALKLALEALEELTDTEQTYAAIERGDAAITAIKEALAQPQQEPVAEIVDYGGYAHVYWKSGPKHPVGTKFYTSPPQRKPLSDEEKLALLKKHFNSVCVPEWFDALLMDVEAVYGIKE